MIYIYDSRDTELQPIVVFCKVNYYSMINSSSIKDMTSAKIIVSISYFLFNSEKDKNWQPFNTQSINNLCNNTVKTTQLLKEHSTVCLTQTNTISSFLKERNSYFYYEHKIENILSLY